MYNTNKTAQRIKELSNKKGVKVADILIKCELGKNTIYSMTERGSWISVYNMAKIADCLECSIDYLLGRTEKPDINN